jgi:hypothetical protein
MNELKKKFQKKTERIISIYKAFNEGAITYQMVSEKTGIPLATVYREINLSKPLRNKYKEIYMRKPQYQVDKFSVKDAIKYGYSAWDVKSFSKGDMRLGSLREKFEIYKDYDSSLRENKKLRKAAEKELLFYVYQTSFNEKKKPWEVCRDILRRENETSKAI